MAMKYLSGSRLWCIVLLCIVLTVCGVFYFGYFCTEKVCALTSARTQPQRMYRQFGGGGASAASSDKSLLSHFNSLIHEGDSQTFELSSGEESASHQTLLPVASEGVKTKKSQRIFTETGQQQQQPQPQHQLQPPYQQQHRPHPIQEIITENGIVLPVKIVGVPFEDIINSTGVQFDIGGQDVVVFLHIQKTGGTTFGRHLIHDLNLDKPCECRKKGKKRKRCKCIRPNSETSYWLFSRLSTGWLCGLHSDWTELTNCVDSVLNKEEGVNLKRR